MFHAASGELAEQNSVQDPEVTWVYAATSYKSPSFALLRPVAGHDRDNENQRNRLQTRRFRESNQNNHKKGRALTA